MEKPFSISTQGAYTVVEFLTPSLMNAADLERISESLHLLVDEQAVTALLLDLSHVEYLASQAIGVIVSLHKKMAAIPGAKLVLCGVGPQLMQLLRITRLDRMLKVVKNKKDVVA